jgi:S1-C subfamily serine protease
MVMSKTGSAQFFLIFAVSSLLLVSQVTAQTPTPTIRTEVAPPIVAQPPPAPQVVTVLHRVNGLKLLRLLMRSGQAFSTLESTDEAFAMTNQVHTNIIAGLAIDDGQTIVAWLPEAEAEVESPFFPLQQPKVFGIPAPADVPADRPRGAGGVGIPQTAPDLAIVGRDGKCHTAHYIGLDGITGLSLLRLADPGLSPGTAVDQEIYVGQRIRLLSPEPAPGAESRANATNSTSAVYVRIGETEGQVVSVARGSTGRLNRIRIRSLKLSAANIGAIAVNDLGQTIGIVDGVEGSEASVLPPEVIRGAAQRVSARQSSVPRPWLGVRGESVAGTPFEQILRNGWKRENAMTLFDHQRGILLTTVVPGSPAALAALRPGDVILQVNDGEVKSEDDFSLLLEEAGDGNQVRFTVVRPEQIGPQSIIVKLSGSLDPSFPARVLAATPHSALASPLFEHGIETIAIRPKATTRAAATVGLLVVYVQPASPAFKSGLRPGDVIESLNGRPIFTTTPTQMRKALTAASYTFDVVRSRQKLVFTVSTPEK